MTRLAALACILILVTGCSRTVDATPVPEPLKLDCNLIFPGPGAA